MTSEVLAQGGRWVRATHTEWCDTYPLYTRPYHLEMPLLTESLAPLLDYPHRDELAFCIPLGLYATPWSDNRFHRFEGFCKAAMLLVRNMARHWDVAEQGVPIFIGISENGQEIFEGYRQACDFPEEQIIALPSMEKYPHNFASAWNVSLDALLSEELSRFHRRIQFDSSIYINPGISDKKHTACANILERWANPEHEGIAITAQPLVELFQEVEDGRTSPRQESSVQTGQHLSGMPDDFWENLAKILGTSADAEAQYWSGNAFVHVPGYIYGISNAFWADARMQRLWPQLQALIASDEGVMSCLLREWDPNLKHVVSHITCSMNQAHWSDVGDVPTLCYMPVVPFSETEEHSLIAWWRQEHDYLPMEAST